MLCHLLLLATTRTIFFFVFLLLECSLRTYLSDMQVAHSVIIGYKVWVRLLWIYLDTCSVIHASEHCYIFLWYDAGPSYWHSVGVLHWLWGDLKTCFTPVLMITSSNGNIIRVTGHLCGELTGPRWIPRTKASDAELWCFLWSAPE